MMRAMGEDPSEQDLSALALDHGKINFDAFLENRQKKWQEAQSGQAVKNAFRFFDEGGTGYVEVSVLESVLLNIGDVFSREDINQFIKDANPQGGKIDYNQFVDKMKRTTF